MHNLFNSTSSNVQATDSKNASGGRAYSLSSQLSLVKYASTGVFNDTYNSDAEEQLDRVLKLCEESDPEFVARVAIYARNQAFMKDTPSFLCAWLARRNIELCKRVFPKVINDGKMLRNFIQVLRSGVIPDANGKFSKSLGTASKKLVQGYLNSLTDEQLFFTNVGNKPSLTDIIRMMHPKPVNKEREALYAYLLGKEQKKENDKDHLFPLAHQFEAFKKGEAAEVPDVPFQMLTALPLSKKDWTEIAKRATFNQVRMNLNTFERHGVFENPEMIDLIAVKLSNPEAVRKSRVMPYQLFTTFMNVNVHPKIKNALQDAAEVALENVPNINGDIYIAVDVSGSMTHAVTGNRGSVTSKTRYVDVAAVCAAAIARKNPNAVILPFDTEVRKIEINARDSIMTNAQKLASIRGGGTDCSSAIRYLNETKAKGRAVIMISDNESWRSYAGKKYYGRNGNKGTDLMHEWSEFAKRNPGARLINIDITPSDTTQTATTPNTMLCAGFNDSIFHVIADYMRENNSDDHWLSMINEIKI